MSKFFDREDNVPSRSSSFFDKEQKRSSFFDREDLPSSPERITEAESALKGAQKGLLWGFSDEAVGVIDSMLKASGNVLTPEGTENPYKDQSFEDTYVEGRDEEREALKKAEEANPMSFMGGELAGALTAPGVGAINKLSKGARGFKEFAKGGAKMGTVEGGIYGAGDSEADTVAGVVADSAKGAAEGAAGGALLGGGFGALTSRFRTKTARDSLPNAFTDEVDDLPEGVQDTVYRQLVPDSAITRAEREAREMAPLDKQLFKVIEDNDPLELMGRKEGHPQTRQDTRRFMEYVVSKAGDIDPKVLKKHKLNVPKDDDPIRRLADDSEIEEDKLWDWMHPTPDHMAADIDIDGNVAPYKKYLEDLAGRFELAKRQGMASEEAWNEFKLGEYLLKQMDKEDTVRRAAALKGLDKDSPDFVKQSVKHYDLKNPLTMGSKHWMDANVALRQIDDATGLDLELIQNRLYDQTNKKKGFDRAVGVILEKAQKRRNKSSLTDEQIIKSLEDGNLSDPVVAGYRTVLDYLLKKSKKSGIDVKSRANYVPVRKKTGVEMVKALEGQGKKLGITNSDKNLDVNKMIGKVDWEDTDDAIVQTLNEMDGTRRDLGYLKYYLQKVHNSEIKTTNQMRDALSNLRNSDVIHRTTQPEVGAVFARKGELPEWIREYNIDKLIWSNTDQTSNAAFILPTAKALDSRIVALRRLGLDDAANYVKNYRLDVSGIQRPKPTGFSPARALKQKLEFMGEDRDNDIIRAAPHMIDAMASAIYPNIIGFNARAVIRNLTQPLVMTASETGFKDSGKIWADSSAAVIRDMVKLGNGNPMKGWTKLKNKMVQEGTIPESVSLQDFEGIRSGVADWTKSKGVKTTQKAIDKYSKAAMFLFGKTDEYNRMVTRYMADRMSDQVVAGNTKVLNKVPASVRDKINSINKRFGIDPEEQKKQVDDVLRRWLLVQTQLAYGKVGSNELGRSMGPGITMMTKWPVAISSDVVDKVKKGEYARLMAKYFGPALAVSLLGRAMYDRDSQMTPRQKQLLGGGGLPSWLPVTSVFSAGDIASPINISTPLELGKSGYGYLTKELEGRANARDRRKIRRAAKRAVQQYVPVAGGMWKTYDHMIEGILKNEDGRNK